MQLSCLVTEKQKRTCASLTSSVATMTYGGSCASTDDTRTGVFCFTREDVTGCLMIERAEPSRAVSRPPCSRHPVPGGNSHWTDSVQHQRLKYRPEFFFLVVLFFPGTWRENFVRVSGATGEPRDVTEPNITASIQASGKPETFSH